MTRTNEPEPAGVASLTHEARAALQAVPLGVRRLRAAREAHAALQAEQAASAEAPRPFSLKPGDQIHAKLTGITFATGVGFTSASHVSRRGETYTITSALIEASYSASGRSWLRHLESEEQQLAAWGAVRFGIGPAPEGMTPERGSSEWVEEREQARCEAWSQPTEQARADALAAVNAKYGPAPVTSTTISTTPDPSIKLAEEQRARLDAGGIRQVNNYEAVRR